MQLERYLSMRPYIEVGLWVAVFSVAFLSQTAVDIIDTSDLNLSTEVWELVTWKGTSILTLMLLIPLVLYFDQACPLTWSSWRRAVPMHVLFSVIFSALHVSIMVTLRKVIYQLNDSYYDFGNWVQEFGYEYLKDFQTYALMLALIYLYRHILFRLQGEASLLSASESVSSNASNDKPERMLVKKLGREFLITVNDIERIEASGNYVNLHIANRVYPLRNTMNNIEQRLNSEQFKRIHRSHIINLDYLGEIIPLDTGDAQVVMKSAEVLPMSRTYRRVVQAFS